MGDSKNRKQIFEVGNIDIDSLKCNPGNHGNVEVVFRYIRLRRKLFYFSVTRQIFFVTAAKCFIVVRKAYPYIG